MRALRIRMSSRTLAVITALGVLALVMALATAIAVHAKGPDGGLEDPPVKALTPDEELALAATMLKQSLGTNSVAGIMQPGTRWVITRWKPSRAAIRDLSRGSSMGWPVIPEGDCSSDQECTDAMEEACTDAGHGGVQTDTVKIVTHADGSQTCSGDCEDNGAIAFVICGPNQ